MCRLFGIGSRCKEFGLWVIVNVMMGLENVL